MKTEATVNTDGAISALAILDRAAEHRRTMAEHPADGPTVSGTVSTAITPAAAGEVTFLSWFPESRIPAAHRAFVQRHVDRAAVQLGLVGRVRVRWFGPAIGEGDFWMVSPFDDGMPSGVAPDSLPMTVAFNKDLRGEALVAIIAHEVRHVAQHAASELLDDKTFRETDADAFAVAYLAETDQ